MKIQPKGAFADKIIPTPHLPSKLNIPAWSFITLRSLLYCNLLYLLIANQPRTAMCKNRC